MSAQPLPDLKAHLAALFAEALAQVAPGASGVVALERPRQAEHGDFACNLALQMAKPLKRNPREIAQALVSALPPSPVLDRAEIAGAGFINLYLKPDAKRGVIAQVLAWRRLAPRTVEEGAPSSFRQSDRAATSATAAVPRTGEPADVCRSGICRLARVLRERCRPADGYPGPVDLAALSGAAGRSGRIPAERLPG
jgi:hypothetical protein